MILKENSWINI